MSRAVLYRRAEELKQRFSFFGFLAVILYLATLLVGGVAYGFSNLPVYLSMNAAVMSQYGPAVFFQSLLFFLSFIALVASAIALFMSRATTMRGEFASSSKLIYAALVTAVLALLFSIPALLPPAAEVIGAAYYIYLIYTALIVVCIVVSLYGIRLLQDVKSYYTPRRK